MNASQDSPWVRGRPATASFQSPLLSTPGATGPHHHSQRGIPTAAATVAADSATLAKSLEYAIEESLRCYIYADAIFYAERLFDMQPNYQHLRTLAHCYMVSGDAQTTCRLLQHHYPFFEVHVTRPSSAGQSRGLGETPLHSFLPSGSAGRSPGPVPIDIRPALYRVEGGEAVLVYEPVDLAARWECQYLLGVSCCQTQRYTQAGRVLEELCRVGSRIESDAQLLQQYQMKIEENVGDIARRSFLGATTAGCPLYYKARLGQVHYWRGVAASRLHGDLTADLFREAYQQNPMLVASFEGYVKTSERPLNEACLAMYNEPYDATPTARGSTSPSLRGHTAQAYTSSDCRELSPRATTLLPRHVPLGENYPLSATMRNGPAGAQVASTQGSCVGGGHASVDTSSSSVRAAQAAAMGSSAARHLASLTSLLRPVAQAIYYRDAYASDNVLALLDGVDPKVGWLTLRTPWRLQMQANALFHNGDMTGSAKAFAELLQVAPWRLNDSSIVTYSTALWHLNEESTLGYLAQRLTEEMPLSAITLCVVANLYSLAKEPTEALEMLNRAIQVDSSMACAYTLKGYELLDLDNKVEAEAAFNNAIFQDRNCYMAYAGMGERFLRDEHLEEARRCYRLALSLNSFPTIMNRYAATYHRRGASEVDLRRALVIYENAVLQHPTNLLAQQQCGDILLRLGRTAEAYHLLTSLLQRNPKEAMTYLTLAKCAQAMGRAREAIRWYTWAVHVDPRREGYVRHCIEKLSAGESTVA